MILTEHTKIDCGLHEMASLEGITLQVTGQCMEPVLHDQDRVQVRRQRKYRVGDILAVRLANGQLVCHRLLGKYFWGGNMHFLTCPDNCRQPDGAVIITKIIGKIVTVNGKKLLPKITLSLRLQLFLSFLYYLCRRFFAKIGI